MAREYAKKFYNTKKWKDMRKYILVRDKYICQSCGECGVMEVHHKKHLTPNNIQDASITLDERNLVTLCRACHMKHHLGDKIAGMSKNKSECEKGYEFDSKGYLIPIAPPGK